MKLVQVLNNNGLVVEEDGREMILIGRGIAFGLSKRQIGKPVAIPEERVQKRFYLENGNTSRFASIISDIPYDYLLAGDEVVRFIRSECSREVSESIYLTLIDHINILAERVRRGTTFDSALLGNVGVLYREEFSLGVRAVDILRRRLHLDIDDSEANFIALHIVNAEMDTSMNQIYEVTSLVERIVSTVESHFDIDSKGREYDRFIIHCRLFVQSLMAGEPRESASKTVPYQPFASHYPEQRSCIDKIAERIEARFPYSVTDEEKLYLLMHLIRLTDHHGAQG